MNGLVVVFKLGGRKTGLTIDDDENDVRHNVDIEWRI